MKSRALSLLAFLLVSTLALMPLDAQAQRWLQTSQLLVEIQNDGPSRALLDTLVQVIERKDSIKVRQSPDKTESLTLSSLRDKLINGPGIGLTSASHVFIDYRFMIRNRGFEESIEGFQFVFRPGQGQEDIPMMYIDAEKRWVNEILKNKGTALTTNEAALKTFSDQLAFARMEGNGKIVEIAGETVREGFEAKKRSLVQKIRRLTYESM
jgi:hypothetical protein